MNENFIYTLNELPSELSWIKEVLLRKEVILNEYNQYKQTIGTAHPELHKVVNQLLNSPFFNMIGTPIYIKDDSVLEQGNRLFCPRLFTPYEKAYIKYKNLADKYNLNSVPNDDLSYMFKESLSILKERTPIETILRSDIVECKPKLDLIEHTHTPRIGVMINLTDTEGPVDVIIEDRIVPLGKEEPVLVFNTSCPHQAKEQGKTNRILFELVLDFE